MSHSPLRMAEAFLQAGELADALDALNRHLEQSPNDVDALRLRAHILIRMPDPTSWEGVINDTALIARLRKLVPEDFILRSLAFEKLMPGLHQALGTLKEGLQYFPTDSRLAERYVHLSIKAGDASLASLALSNLPREWRVLQWQGDIAAADGEFDKAVHYYSDAIDDLRQRHPQIFEIPADAPRLTPGSTAGPALLAAYARLLLARADVYFRLEQYEQADEDYNAAGPLVPGDVMVIFNRGLAALVRGDEQTAAALCQEALAAANPALFDHMRAALTADPRWLPLRHLAGDSGA